MKIDFLKIEETSTTTPMLIERIHFFDEIIGNCITLDGRIFKTKDKGVNWSNTYINPSSDFKLTDLTFIDKKIGFAVGGSTSCNGTGCNLPDGLILKTIDGGDTWNVVKRIPQSDIPSITKGDNNILYATNLFFAGQGPATASTKILKSTDLGQTWDSIASIKIYPQRMTCNGETVFVTGGIGLGKIFKGTNGGRTWKETVLDTMAYTTEIEFKNGVGYCLANNQSLFKTIDNGENWLKVYNGRYNSFRMALLSENTCFLFGGGRNLNVNSDFPNILSAYKLTIDGGKNWQEVEFRDIGFYATHFFNDKMGYISNRDRRLAKITLK
ncbi:MAG: hypothetical protein HC817_01975 [Saprospiraceae bacterium]|nr:hypothetical protein [Saprospiraceae bacterium]